MINHDRELEVSSPFSVRSPASELEGPTGAVV